MLIVATSFGLLNSAVLIVYLSVLVFIGVKLAGRQTSTEEYFLAGRRMPWLVVGVSMYASLTSAISYLSIPGRAFEENASLIVAGFVSLAAAPVLILLFYPFYRQLNVTTSYEYVLQRYGPTARTAVSSLFVLARLGWLGTVIYAPALALSVVTKIPIAATITIMGVLATIYTMLGGLAAVLWTDLFQFLVLAAGAVWVAVSVTTSVPGGSGAIFDLADATGRLDIFDLRYGLFEMTGIAVALMYFVEMLQSYGTDQVTVQRLMSVKTYGGMAKAAVFNSVSDLVFSALLLYVGLGLFAYFHHFPEALPDNLVKDGVLPFYIMHALPDGISGLLITAIFAAAMSSMDSGINSLATVLVNDFVKPRRPAMKEAQGVSLARSMTLGLGIVATAIAFYVSTLERLLQASSEFLSLFAAPVLVIFLMGMLSRRVNFPGWLTGVAVSIPSTYWVQKWTDVHYVHYGPFSFAVCAVTTVVASYVIGKFWNVPLGDRCLTIWGRDDPQG